MKSAMTGVVLGAAAGLVVCFAYLLSQWSASEPMPDAPALLLGLQLASGVGAALGCWVGILVSLLLPGGRPMEEPIGESAPSLADTTPQMERVSAR